MTVPIGQLASMEPTDSRTPTKSIYQIALTSTGIQWQGNKLWDMPEITEIKAFPFLAVIRPKFFSYLIDGAPVGKELRRRPGLVEKAYDVDVYGILDFHPEDPGMYEEAERMKDILDDTFIVQFRLNKGALPTADVANPMNPITGPLLFQTGEKFWCAMVSIRFKLARATSLTDATLGFPG